jgi:orotate phosphoribosyltransferase
MNNFQIGAAMNYKEKFVRLMIESGVLRFGEFKTKSGRLSPYFINTGNFNTGRHIALLGEYYADVISEKLSGGFDFLYGPAYKGIPIACAASIALYNKYGVDVPYSFNRKEAKDHGEGGVIVSYQPKDGDRALILEDVITAGTSVRENIPILKAAADVRINHMIISCDRKEKGYNGKTAATEIKEEFGIETHSIVDIFDILNIIDNEEASEMILLTDMMKTRIREYIDSYCEKK